MIHVGRTFRKRRPRDPWADAAERVERVMLESGLPLDEVLVGSDLDGVARRILAFRSWDTERPNWHRSIGDHVAPTPSWGRSCTCSTTGPSASPGRRANLPPRGSTGCSAWRHGR
jgi:hypothetical protein